MITRRDRHRERIDDLLHETGLSRGLFGDGGFWCARMHGYGSRGNPVFVVFDRTGPLSVIKYNDLSRLLRRAVTVDFALRNDFIRRGLDA